MHTNLAFVTFYNIDMSSKLKFNMESSLKLNIANENKFCSLALRQLVQGSNVYLNYGSEG